MDTANIESRISAWFKKSIMVFSELLFWKTFTMKKTQIFKEHLWHFFYIRNLKNWLFVFCFGLCMLHYYRIRDFSYETLLSFGILFVFLFIYSLIFHKFTQNFLVKFFWRSLFWIGRCIAIGEIKQYKVKGNVFIRKLEISQNIFFQFNLAVSFYFYLLYLSHYT